MLVPMVKAEMLAEFGGETSWKVATLKTEDMGRMLITDFKLLRIMLYGLQGFFHLSVKHFILVSDL